MGVHICVHVVGRISASECIGEGLLTMPQSPTQHKGMRKRSSGAKGHHFSFPATLCGPVQSVAFNQLLVSVTSVCTKKDGKYGYGKLMIARMHAKFCGMTDERGGVDDLCVTGCTLHEYTAKRGL